MNPLHASEMRTYLRCPREWSLAYQARRVPREKSEALTRGTAVHRWLEAWWTGRDAELPADPIAHACCIGYAANYGSPPPGAEVEVAFTATVAGVEVAGTVDALVRVAGQPLMVVEHKTTSESIEAGSLFWQEMTHCSEQSTLYLAAFPGAAILYDVIRKPGLRKLRAGKPNEETDTEFVARCVEDIGKRPEYYFARFTVVALDAERVDTEGDVVAVDRLRRGGVHPRSVRNCVRFGRRCGYWAHCHDGIQLSNETFFTDQEVGR